LIVAHSQWVRLINAMQLLSMPVPQNMMVALPVELTRFHLPLC